MTVFADMTGNGYDLTQLIVSAASQ